MAMIDLRNATVKLKDGGFNSLEIKIGQGNLTYSEKRQIDPVLSRGKVDTVRENEDQLMQVSFNFIWEFLKSSGLEPPTIEECLKHTGPAASWISANSDIKAPFSVNIEIEHIPPCSGVDKETVELPMFNYLELAHSLMDGTVACNGLCNAKVPNIRKGSH